MKRFGFGSAFILVALCSLLAQPQSHTGVARVSFEQRWPASDPQWFELVVQDDGSAKYRSLPHQESKLPAEDPAPEPYELAFTLSPPSRQFIFAVGSELPRFEGSLDRIKVAFTGAKTLLYEDGSGNRTALSYNYSSSPELSRLTALIQGISESIEFSQTLQSQMRFDKLALDATLKRIEDISSLRPLAEPQLLEAVLKRIANDPAFMNIARQRARRILQAPPGQK